MTTLETFNFFSLVFRSPSNIKQFLQIETVTYDVCRKQYTEITINEVCIWIRRFNSKSNHILSSSSSSSSSELPDMRWRSQWQKCKCFLSIFSQFPRTNYVSFECFSHVAETAVVHWCTQKIPLYGNWLVLFRTGRVFVQLSVLMVKRQYSLRSSITFHGSNIMHCNENEFIICVIVLRNQVNKCEILVQLSVRIERMMSFI